MSDIIEFGEKRKERDLAQEQKDSEECEQLYDDLYAVFFRYGPVRDGRRSRY
jgi:hypothetical protein